MGIFSFIKNAGAKIFNKKPDAAAVEVAAATSKVDALKSEVQRLGLPVSGLDMDLTEGVIVHGTVATNADREKVILAIGNVDGIGAVDDRMNVTNPEPESTFHAVVAGDSLSKVAQKVYGDPMKYTLIFEANKPMLSHPDKIYPGQMLRIPPLS